MRSPRSRGAATRHSSLATRNSKRISNFFILHYLKDRYYDRPVKWPRGKCTKSGISFAVFKSLDWNSYNLPCLPQNLSRSLLKAPLIVGSFMKTSKVYCILSCKGNNPVFWRLSAPRRNRQSAIYFVL